MIMILSQTIHKIKNPWLFRDFVEVGGELNIFFGLNYINN